MQTSLVLSPDTAFNEFLATVTRNYPELVHALTSRKDLHNDCTPSECKASPFEFTLEGEAERATEVLSKDWEYARSVAAYDPLAAGEEILLMSRRAFDLGAWVVAKGLYRLKGERTSP